MTRLILAAACIIHATVVLTVYGDEFPEPFNTQAAGEHPPPPDEMPGLFDLPPGVKVTLFAGEPDIRQPIAFDFDDRGRLWVAENQTYSGRGDIEPKLRDRVIILEDSNGDGRHDIRTVFWNRGRMLTGLAWGHGGIWVLNDATLSFIPDRDGDDRPDGEPVVMLDGWSKEAGHNFVNGLMWGPDGWLYGRHGILDTSRPAPPGTAIADRPAMNCGIWRFHPVRHVVDVICHGTVNPWGMDFDQYGQLFMTNNVRNHLWHVLPGAHYERMFGQDFNPHLYELMGPSADHYHWDTTGNWTESRDGVAASYGGGHSHCGGMIYLGQNLPSQYHGRIFMCNTHGRCVNVDRLQRSGSGYTARHESDFLKVRTPWFRGIDLKYGPAGCVYVSDWSDFGECHDHDGVHRTSGRIFRIWAGEPEGAAAQIAESLRNTDSEVLVGITLGHESEWLRRHAARKLTEQAVPSEALKAARQVAADPQDEIRTLNAAWLLHALDQLDSDTVRQMLTSPFDRVRGAAIRFACETPGLGDQTGDDIVVRLRTETSPFVLMAAASAIRTFPAGANDDSAGRPVHALRQDVLDQLCYRSTVAADMDAFPQLRRMIWYRMEESLESSTVPELPPDPVLRRWLIRRLASETWPVLKGRLSRLLTAAANERPQSISGTTQGRQGVTAILAGLTDGFRGRRQVPEPDHWNEVVSVCRALDDPEIDRSLDELSVLFGDGVALEQLRQLVADRDGDPTARTQAINVLAQSGEQSSIPLFLKLLDDRAVGATIVRALAEFDDPRIAEVLLRLWPNLRSRDQELVIDTLISRPKSAQALIQDVARQRVDVGRISAAQIRQLRSFEDPYIDGVIEERWGILRDTPADKAAVIASWMDRLSDDVLTEADLARGEIVFRRVCGTCHRLYGEGSMTGPDLTGANRGRLDYLLSNIIDPSAEVARQHTVTVLAMRSGRVINGVILSETAQTVTLQTDREQLTIAVNDIDARRATRKSLMPDGLLDPLPPEEVRDLIAFLQRIR